MMCGRGGGVNGSFIQDSFFMKSYCPGGGFILVSHLRHRAPSGFDDETLGVIAQLVERLNGIEEVWGSNPHGSTKRFLDKPSKKEFGLNLMGGRTLVRLPCRDQRQSIYP